MQERQHMKGMHSGFVFVLTNSPDADQASYQRVLVTEPERVPVREKYWRRGI